jgi:hypothetical protein
LGTLAAMAVAKLIMRSRRVHLISQMAVGENGDQNYLKRCRPARGEFPTPGVRRSHHSPENEERVATP